MATRDERYNEADKLKEDGRLPEAVAMLEQLAADEPDFPLVHFALAKHYTSLGKHEDGIRHALKAVELEPNDAFSYTALSVIYQRAGKIREAEDAKAKAHSMQGH